MRSRRGCLTALVLLLLLGAGAWWFRAGLLRLVRPAPDPIEISPLAAERAAGKLERLRSGGQPATLSDVEISSLVRYKLQGWVPRELAEPEIGMSGDTLRLIGRVAGDRLPVMEGLDEVRAMLPDTARVVVQGRLQPLRGGRAAFEVLGVDVAGIPLPRRYYPEVLQRIGRRDEAGVAPNAVGFALPDGVFAARVANGQLILEPVR